MQTIAVLAMRRKLVRRAGMKAYIPSRAPCPIGRASRVLGDRWAMLILREAFLGVEHFEHFLALTSRLGILVAAGLFERVPPTGKRAAYRLTEAGRALGPTYEAIKTWGDAWLPPAPRPEKDAHDQDSG
jgi:DNA-binding HxlR family transcriptional regulator